MTQTPVAVFKGREITMRLPNDAQILVWNRVVKQLNELYAELVPYEPGTKLPDELAKRHRKMVNRLSDMLFAMIDGEDDAEWLEDEILAGRIVDTDLLELFTAFGDAVERSRADEGEQMAKPAAPAKKSAAKRTKS